MKLSRSLGSLALAVCVAGAVSFALLAHPHHAIASATHTLPTDPASPNLYLEGVVDATASSTFATTSYADLPAATVTMPAVTYDNAGDYAYVCYSADVIKATTTTGTLAIWINGAVVAKTARTIDVAAKQGTMGGCFTLALTAQTANIVKLQGKSGDTATFTVNNAELTVWRVHVN